MQIKFGAGNIESSCIADIETQSICSSSTAVPLSMEQKEFLVEKGHLGASAKHLPIRAYQGLEVEYSVDIKCVDCGERLQRRWHSQDKNSPFAGLGPNETGSQYIYVHGKHHCVWCVIRQGKEHFGIRKDGLLTPERSRPPSVEMIADAMAAAAVSLDQDEADKEDEEIDADLVMVGAGS